LNVLAGFGRKRSESCSKATLLPLKEVDYIFVADTEKKSKEKGPPATSKNG
jgi:hypothetical protein